MNTRAVILGLLLTIAPAISHAELRLYVFNCGTILMPDVSMFGISNDDTDVRELIVPCYLIQHDEHLMVWDAGLPAVAVGDTSGNSRYEVSFIDQLKAMNITPEDVDFASYSHFHYDHVGMANEFKSATLLIQEAEAIAAFNNFANNPVFRPELYSEIQESTRVTMNGDYDVFGDGSVRIISAPGHTPGHSALYLELENFGPLILSGDLYHFEASRALRATPVFNTNAEESLRSMDKIEALIEETGATFWIEHNKALAETLNMAPAFYN